MYCTITRTFFFLIAQIKITVTLINKRNNLTRAHAITHTLNTCTHAYTHTRLKTFKICLDFIHCTFWGHSMSKMKLVTIFSSFFLSNFAILFIFRIFDFAVFQIYLIRFIFENSLQKLLACYPSVISSIEMMICSFKHSLLSQPPQKIFKCVW